MIPASGCGVLCAGGELVQRDFLNFWNVVVGALRATPKVVLRAKTSTISWQAKRLLCTGLEALTIKAPYNVSVRSACRKVAYDNVIRKRFDEAVAAKMPR